MNTQQNYTYRVILESDDGGYHAFVPALPGCHTWGKSISEARDLIRDAIDVYLRSVIVDGKMIPVDTGIELFETIPAPRAMRAPRRSLVHA